MLIIARGAPRNVSLYPRTAGGCVSRITTSATSHLQYGQLFSCVDTDLPQFKQLSIIV